MRGKHYFKVKELNTKTIVLVSYFLRLMVDFLRVQLLVFWNFNTVLQSLLSSSDQNQAYHIQVDGLKSLLY